MDNEIQLISDGDGLAVIGKTADVERFLVSEGLSSNAPRTRRLKSIFQTGAAIAEIGSEVAANSGHWVKLTSQSAHLVAKHGLRVSRETGLSTGVVRGSNGGQIGGFVQFAQGPQTLLTNPAALANVGVLMAQLAMKQTMDEITDYLAVIDAKVDDVLRAQNDAALADMIAVHLVIEEAMTIREAVGRVSEITWSKVQGGSMAIARTQAYALRQLDALAEKMERETKVADLATTAKNVEYKAREWLAVLARSFQLHDASAVLELDRVSDSSPKDLNNHRLGLRAARQKRLDLISRSTELLIARMNAAADVANAKVLLHPTKSPAVVQSSNHVVTGIHDLHGRLGIESGRKSAEAKRWVDAVVDVKDKAVETGAKGADAARGAGGVTLDRAGLVKAKLAERARRKREAEEKPDTEG